MPKDFDGVERRLLEAQHRNGGIGDQSSNGADRALNRANVLLVFLFWVQMSIGIGGRIHRTFKYNGGTLKGGVPALYPALCTVSLLTKTKLYNVMQVSLSPSDAVAGHHAGVVAMSPTLLTGVSAYS